MNVKSNSVATFYRFVELQDLSTWQQQLEAQAQQLELRGTVLLAQEGINGTLVGTQDNLDRFVGALLARPELASMPVKRSTAAGEHPVFHRLKVRVKPEIVAMGLPAVRPAERTGTHVGAQRWHELLDDPDVPVLDVRNTYETEIGRFGQATDPKTQSFREFPEYVAQHLDPATQPKVAMYCTGGIRCEKASAYLLDQGFSEVFQLDGGILNYLAEVEPQTNRWEGECFVFDQRVSVDSKLEEGGYQQCFACRHAVTEEDLQSPKYVRGRSCPRCFDDRQRQVELAAQRGTKHIGADYNKQQEDTSGST
ncbi:UNVERIFIED_CONTAM: hypothetical protein GTU68_023018 [Idotea baltica]|nr:hypothetical protein [Idotea baltica]